MCLMIAAAACQTDPGEDEADGASAAPQQPSNPGPSQAGGPDETTIDSLPEFVSEGIAAQVEQELARPMSWVKRGTRSSTSCSW